MTLRVLDEWETLRTVSIARMSMARFGDGEIKLARGVSCKTQPQAEGIGKRLRQVLLSTAPGVLVCIPRIFAEEPPLATKGYWPQHISTFNRMCDPTKQYGSSFVTRRDAWPIENEDCYWQRWQTIWADRPVLLVTGSKKGQSSQGRLLATAHSVDVLECPRQGAWAAYSGILHDCRAWAVAKLDPCVVAACGATATVLAHELGAEGIQTLDMGHAAQAIARVSPKELAEA